MQEARLPFRAISEVGARGGVCVGGGGGMGDGSRGENFI